MDRAGLPTTSVVVPGFPLQLRYRKYPNPPIWFSKKGTATEAIGSKPINSKPPEVKCSRDPNPKSLKPKDPKP